jgi:hypothetical protein
MSSRPGYTFGPVRDPRRTWSDPTALDFPQPLNTPKTSSPSPQHPRDRSRLFHPQRLLTRDVSTLKLSRLNTVGNVSSQLRFRRKGAGAGAGG